MQKDAFKPQGREVPVMGMAPMMGGGGDRPRMIPMGQPPAQGRQPQQPQQPTPVAPRGGGAPISDRSGAFKPMGQPVRIMGGGNPALDGGAVDRGASFQPSQPAIAPAPAPAPGPEMAAAPRPFMQRRENGSTIMRVILSGIGPDGTPYAAPYDAEFVPGSHSFKVEFAPLT